MKRITSKFVSAMVAVMLVVMAAFTAVGAVSTPDTAEETLSYFSYCLNVSTDAKTEKTMSVSTAHYDTHFANYEKLAAGTYEFGVYDPYTELTVTADVTLKNTGSVRVYYSDLTHEISTEVYDSIKVDPEREFIASLISKDDSIFKSADMTVSAEHYNAATCVFNSLPAGEYTISILGEGGTVSDSDFTLSEKSSVRIYYYYVAGDIEVKTLPIDAYPNENPSGVMESESGEAINLIFDETVHSGIFTSVVEDVDPGTYSFIILTGKGTYVYDEYTVENKSDLLITYSQTDDTLTFVELSDFTPEDPTVPAKPSNGAGSSTNDVATKDSVAANNDNGVVKTGESAVPAIVILSLLSLGAAGMFVAKRKLG